LRTDITNKIIGSNTDSITVLNATIADIGDNNALVRVEITGRCPNQTTVSNAVLLIFNPDLSITSQSAANTNTCVASNLLLYINTNSNATYVWKKNGAVISNQTNDTLLINGVTNNDAGTYTCEATSTCGNLTSDSMVVAVNAALNPSITQSGNTLSTQTFNTYQWFKNGTVIAGATAQNYNATESGLYSVFVSNTGGCNATSANYNFTFVGLNEILNLNQLFSVYPNPASNIITINVDGVNSQWNIKLLDIAGSEILSTQMNYQTTINVETLAKGVYIVRATNSDGQQANIRFVKN
ncbi:MAG: T9SS type A sorting domain-containing protein, partial [Bacteroidia bacterium]|nr:T9SS type A sorting domain-containing protein [Bacteroidia bacterium]